MRLSDSLQQWLRRPPATWSFHAVVAGIVIFAITVMLTLREVYSVWGYSNYHYTVWLVTPVAMSLLLVWGARALWGILAGSLIGFLFWYPWELALVGTVDETLQVGLGIFLMYRFWPEATPLKPSVRFFALLIFFGVTLPVCLFSVPTVFAFYEGDALAMDTYWDFYFQWCISEISGVLIVLPALLMLVYPQFRRTVERPAELVLYIAICVTLIAVSVFDVFEVSGDQIMRMERWIPICTVIFIIIVRNGVGGVIIANLAMAAAMIGIEIVFSSTEVPWITAEMLLEFDLYANHFMALALIVAAGFYDHKMLNQMSHNITAKILSVQTAERSRFAADLHDNVSQEFAAALIHLRKGLEDVPAAQENENIQQAKVNLKRGIDELCHAAAGLRSELLEHKPFGEVIQSCCDAFGKRYGIDVLLADNLGKEDRKLPLKKQEHLFRIIQKALRNAVRHGKAKLVTVELLYSKQKGGLFIARIEDDGVGFDLRRKVSMADRPHLGLRLMEERTFIMGGNFSIASEPNKGTVVEIKVPFNKGEKPSEISQELEWT